MKNIAMAAALIMATSLGTAGIAQAGSETGDVMVRILATGVITQDDTKSLQSTAIGDLKAAGFDASVSDEVIPALTLSYFLTRNVAVELFCCFAQHSVELQSPNPALAGEIANSWIFPPALTLQYHFDGMGAFKPYVGAGFQYIAFFDEETGDNRLASSRVHVDDAFGLTLQAGFDVALGGGWYWNADVKKTWLDTTATWSDSLATPGHTITADVDLDPLIVSTGVAYRFNLSDLLGAN